MRKLRAVKGELTLTDEFEVILERKVTQFGTSAKADVPKRYMGRRVYVIVTKEDAE